MIIRFSFQNFKSYKNETTLDFQSAAIPEFDNAIIKREKVSSLLPVSAVYGPNGGGKTNLLMALACLISIVVDPICKLEKNRTKVYQQTISYQPFLFDDDSEDVPTIFDLFFRTAENEFRYYISLQNGEIIDECLYKKTYTGKKTAMIFERERNLITLGASLKSKTINTDVNPKMPFLSFLGINYNIPVITEAQCWFESCILRNYADSASETSLMLSSGKDQKKNILRLMNDMGIDISDYEYDNEHKELYLYRTIGGKKYELNFLGESAGTQKLFSVLPYVIIALNEGRLMIVDELDAKLHPKLLRYIIFLFKNTEINRLGAQLLFTSHDLTTMSNSVFRRDEIWFAALNENRESEIYSLYDIRTVDDKHINNTAAYSKQYLEGRYGADPYLKTILDWEVKE